MSNTTKAPPLIDNDILSDIIAGGGIAGLILNLLFLIALLKDKKLRKNCLLLIGLTVGHILSGITHTLVGIRPYIIPLSDFNEPATAWYCMTIMIPPLLVFVFQILPLNLLFIGAERLLALGAPIWFKQFWKGKTRLAVTAAPFVICSICALAEWIRAWVTPGYPTTKSCSPSSSVVGDAYSKYGVRLLSILSGSLAGVFTFCAVCIGRRRMKKVPKTSVGEISRVKKQMRLTQCMLAIAFIDVVCVVVPNIFLLLSSFGYQLVPSGYNLVYGLLLCYNSSINVFAYVFCNKEFRMALMSLVKFNKVAPSAYPTSGFY